MEVTGTQWHPTDRNVIATSSLDGTVRLWHLDGEALFGNLTSKYVLKIKSKASAARIGATCCCFSPDGMYCLLFSLSLLLLLPTLCFYIYNEVC